MNGLSDILPLILGAITGEGKTEIINGHSFTEYEDGSFEMGGVLYSPKPGVPAEKLAELKESAKDHLRNHVPPAGKTLGDILTGLREKGSEQPLTLGDVIGDAIIGAVEALAKEASEKPEGETLSDIVAPMLDAHKKAMKPFETQDNGVMLLHHGLKVVHIYSQDIPNVGMTVVYKTPEGFNGNERDAQTFEVATSVCHPSDNFNKKKGTATAITNFLAGRTVTLPVIHSKDIIDSIKCYFTPAVARK